MRSSFLKVIFSVSLCLCGVPLAGFAQSARLSYFRVAVLGALPSGRVDAPIIYDAPARRLLMFGGQDSAPRNDLWAFSLEGLRWEELQPSGPLPPARFGHTTIFDPVRRRLIVFGGQGSRFFSDTWAYDIARNIWQQLSPDEAGPNRRYAHSAIYDAVQDRLVISHGFTDAGRFDDTWAFTLAANTWQNVSPAGTRPLRRCLHHAVYDEKNSQMLLFGGCASGFGPCPLDDLWSFNLNTGQWIELTPGSRPPARQWYGMALDNANADASAGGRRRLLLFGGMGAAASLNDTWEYDFAANSWTQLSPGGEIPTRRSRHETSFVAQLGYTFFFGGRTDAGLTNELWVLLASAPTINTGGAVNGASFASGVAVAAGSIASVFGANLASGTELADAVPLPTTLGGATLRFQAASAQPVAAPQFFASPKQVNIQIPWELAGQVQAALTDTVGGVASAGETVPLANYAPGLFSLNQRGSGQGAILIAATGELAAPSGSVPGRSARPALRGEYVSIFCTGLGDVTNRPASGAAALRDPLSTTLAVPTVTIGGIATTVSFSGLAPDFVGLYQVNVQVPAAAPVSDAVPIVLTIGGASSNTVTMAVQ